MYFNISCIVLSINMPVIERESDTQSIEREKDKRIKKYHDKYNEFRPKHYCRLDAFIGFPCFATNLKIKNHLFSCIHKYFFYASFHKNMSKLTKRANRST